MAAERAGMAADNSETQTPGPREKNLFGKPLGTPLLASQAVVILAAVYFRIEFV
jgi:hypothetical protein